MRNIIIKSIDEFIIPKYGDLLNSNLNFEVSEKNENSICCIWITYTTPANSIQYFRDLVNDTFKILKVIGFDFVSEHVSILNMNDGFVKIVGCMITHLSP